MAGVTDGPLTSGFAERHGKLHVEVLVLDSALGEPQVLTEVVEL
jgi:hypothetical protein